MVSSRRGVRAAGAGIQNVSCLVDGCDSDLSSCREYHRRHKVCEAHSKTPIVLVGGKEQRFCQQCSRFHLLGEFDEVKRSCRKRLDGHNRRRRKPQQHLTNPRNLFTDQQGHAFVSYQSLYNHITPNSYWAVKNREPDPYRNRQPAPVITRQDHSLQYAQNYKEGKRFPFLQDGGVSISRNSSSTLDVLVPQHVNTFSSSESSGGGQMLSEGFVQVLESECAPSLLSSPAQSASFYPAPLVLATSDHIPLGQPLVRDLQHSILDKYPCMQAPSAVSSTGIYHMGISEDHAGTVLVPDTNGADFGYLGTFDGSPDDQSPSGPFPWQ